MTYLLLAIATLLSSIVSGVLSMAGGMILMAVFSAFLSIPAAMVLHGVAQAVSNGARVWLYRQHIQWPVLVPYTAAATLILILFVSFSFIPNKSIVFILIGSFPFLSLILPEKLNLDIQRKPIAFISGLMVTSAQMLAGASGPVLDIFYTQSSLTRQEILATKAITQTLGHVIKLVYYLFLLSLDSQLPIWLFPIIVLMAIIGNYMASWIVVRINDEQFKRAGRSIIMLVGVICIYKGMTELGI